GRARLAGERLLERRVGDLEAAQVGDVLAQGEAAVYVGGAVHHGVGVELGRDAARAVLKALRVVRGPPVAQVALGGELAALVVDAVGHLVADHGAHAAVVHGVVGGGVEERRLENPGGEGDVVERRAVRRVHGGGGHAPLGLVHRLGDAGQG